MHRFRSLMKPTAGQTCGSKNVGSHPSGASPYGLQDMAGSVFEFVSDYYDQSYYSAYSTTKWPSNPQGSNKKNGHVVRGGSLTSNGLQLRSYLRQGTDGPSWSVGFRCAWSASK